jgi:F0F1-type ATP synthase membrane subunit b/b'
MQTPTAVPAVTPTPLGRTITSRSAVARTAFVPLLLLAIAFVVFAGFQTLQMVTTRSQLSQAQVNLEPQIQQAAKVRASLDAVATATAKLATEGNGNAQVIVEQLRKRGITINAAGAAKP